MNSSDLMKYWLKEIVIGLNLCPFAFKPFQENKVHFLESDSDNIDKAYSELKKHIQIFSTKNTTDLFFFPKLSLSFENFYELFMDLEEYLEINSITEIQLVCFHPEFRFEGLDEKERANFVNRSPYACVHFLKTSEFDNIILERDTGEKISYANEKKLKALSPEEFKKLFYFSPKIA